MEDKGKWSVIASVLSVVIATLFVGLIAVIVAGLFFKLAVIVWTL